MGLSHLVDLQADLQCPRCGSPISRDYRCAACGHQYAMVGPWPVLVDFDRSVLKEEQITDLKAASIISRRTTLGLAGVMRDVLRTRNKCGEANIARFLAHVPRGGRVLVIGGGTIGQGLQTLYDSLDIDVVGFDIYGSKHVQFIADAHQIPFQDASFDGAIVQAVLEHVLTPSAVVSEIWRVLKADGWVYSETPFLQHVHEGPYDFTRFTHSGHRWLFAKFRIIASGPLDGPAAQFLWSVHYLVWGLTGSRNVGLVVRTLLKPLILLDRLISREFRVDSTTCSYLIAERSDHEVSPHEAISYYQGAQ